MWFLSPKWTLTETVTHSFKESFSILKVLELNSASLPANHCLLQALTQQSFIECHSQAGHWDEEDTAASRNSQVSGVSASLLSLTPLGSMLLVNFVELFNSILQFRYFSLSSYPGFSICRNSGLAWKHKGKGIKKKNQMRKSKLGKISCQKRNSVSGRRA